MGLSTAALHRQLLSLGVPSTLCATYGQSPQRPAEYTHEFRRRGPGYLYYSPELDRKAKDLVARVEVIHGHGFYVGTNYVFGREARRQGKPLIYHVHGFFEPWILARSRWKKGPVHLLFEDANFKHVRLWRALTNKEADQIRARGIQAPIVVAPVGIELKDFEIPHQEGEAIVTPLVPKLIKAGRRAVFISRVHPKKGLDLLVPAWAALGAAAKDWELIIAGPDEAGYAQTVASLVRSADLEKAVRIVGKVSPEAKVKLLKSADLFVLPSYSEGFSSAILEAMAVSAPVIATRCCNFSELFQEGGGWECEANPQSLVGALRAGLGASDEERKQRGRVGRALLERHYTWAEICRGLVEACEKYC